MRERQRFGEWALLSFPAVAATQCPLGGLLEMPRPHPRVTTSESWGAGPRYQWILKLPPCLPPHGTNVQLS